MYRWYSGEKKPGLKALFILFLVSSVPAVLASHLWAAYESKDPPISELSEFISELCIYAVVMMLVLRALFWLFYRDRSAK